ncbi:uncharacterized protein [Choristoneura fumiferana]|uniref:uncharacterized protein n=1 Tax=Choristoneura fumiferana TaxID=7141 RepID=UPI003D15DB57
MSFFGKQFKKVKVENGPEFFEKLKLSEQILALLRQKESVTTFTKTSDSTLQYVIKAGDKVVLDQKIDLGKEIDFTTPGGIATKVFFSLEGDVLNSYMKFPDGTTVHMDRSFDAAGMKLVLYVDGSPTRATVFYEAL